jgi:hypothetical protein
LDFLDVLDGAISTAKGELSDAYYSKDPNVLHVADSLGTLGKDLGDLKTAIKNLPNALTSLPSVKPIKGSLNGFLLGAAASVQLINKGRTSVMPLLINTQLPGLSGDLDRLANAATAAGDSTSATLIQAEKTALDKQISDLKTSWNALDAQAARAKANAHANADFAPAENVLNRLLYTVNTFSIAPVAIFDIARVWPEQYGTRYAPGGGLRLSIVNANFTFGYAYNPTQAHHDGTGAMFFNLDFTDLFR